MLYRIIFSLLIGLIVYIPNDVSAESIQERLVQTVFHGGGRITCDFHGYQTRKGYHEGVDMSNYHKAPVYAVISGRVINAGSGNYHTVSIYDEKNNKSIIYLHFDSVAVRRNQLVKKGDLIGYQGNYAPENLASHVHIEVRDGQKEYAAKSSDNIPDNSNPWTYWNSVLNDVIHTKPSNLRISTDKKTYMVGESINFTFSADNATTRMAIPIDINGKRAEWLDVSGRNSYSYRTRTPGQYYYTLYAQNPAGEVNVEYFPIKVVAAVRPSNLRITTDKKTYMVGETINFTFSADNATTRMAIPIDINGKRAEWLDVSGRNSYAYKTRTAGQYYYTLYAQNPAGEVNVDYFPIKVIAAAKPSNLRISTDKTTYVVGETINFTFSADNATTRMAIPIDINGKRAEWLDVSGRNSYSYKTHTPGQYYYTLYAQNPVGEINIAYYPIKVVASAQQNSTSQLKGDVNGDGRVNKQDVDLLLAYLQGKTSNIVKANADVNGDGRINVMDVVALNRMV